FRRRDQQHHAGTGSQSRSADGSFARSLARQCRCDGTARARGKGAPLEQVVSSAIFLGGWAHPPEARERSGDPFQALAFYALSLVQAAARWNEDGGIDV